MNCIDQNAIKLLEANQDKIDYIRLLINLGINKWQLTSNH
jgi:hypothetical protein